MEFNILKGGQLIKSKKYVPNPVVRFGIPAYADSKSNPKVVDTLAYHQYWEEQLYYIHNGYTTGGITIPGRYYKFVNFDPAQTAKGVGPMELHDYQLDYAYWIDHLKSPSVRMNAYVPKARRKALSVMTVGMVIDYGWRFKDNYHAAVVAGLQEYADDFMAKWKYINMHMVKEFRIRTLKMNDDEVIAGWREQTEEGWIDKGTQNTIYIKTVNNNPNVLKGKFLNDIVYEESGENELLLETIAASEDCLKVGSIQYGTSFIYGTGGNMAKGSKGFKEINFHLNTYNAERFYVPAYVFFEPAYSGAVNEFGQLVEDVPNLLHMKPHERVGWSDFERGKELIEIKKKELLAEGDMEKYIKYCQNNPVKIEEIFRQSSSNNFDILKLNDQLYKIANEYKKYNRWHLSYKRNPKTGEQLMPPEIDIRPATDKDQEHECVYILNDGHPVKGYKYLDVAGVDSYDQNQAKHSKSLGAMAVFRRAHNIKGIEHTSWAPVAIIRNRPKYKEQFYDLCIMLSIYYDLQESVLIDIGAGMIIKHFEDTGNARYLSIRPKKFESPNSNQTHQFGFSFNTYSIPKVMSALQSLFDFHIDKIWFDKVLEEALNYDDGEMGKQNGDGDGDLLDALGMAVIKAIDMDVVPMNEDALLVNNPYQYPEWAEDADGHIIDKSSNMFIDEEPLGKSEDYVSRMNRMNGNINNDMFENDFDLDIFED
jgi:hypothetical protein